MQAQPYTLHKAEQLHNNLLTHEQFKKEFFENAVLMGNQNITDAIIDLCYAHYRTGYRHHQLESQK